MDTICLEQKVKEIIARQLIVDSSEIKPESTFIEDLGADSLDMVELNMAFEQVFNIEIPDEDAEKIVTVKDAIEYIEKKRGDKKTILVKPLPSFEAFLEWEGIKDEGDFASFAVNKQTGELLDKLISPDDILIITINRNEYEAARKSPEQFKALLKSKLSKN